MLALVVDVSQLIFAIFHRKKVWRLKSCHTNAKVPIYLKLVPKGG
jgi:hypothetical protein